MAADRNQGLSEFSSFTKTFGRRQSSPDALRRPLENRREAHSESDAERREAVLEVLSLHLFFFSSRRRHTSSVSAFLLNRSSDLFSGRVQQTYKHSVPRFFVPEHGTMFTLALVRFPPTATKEIQYLNAKGALTYTDIAGDPVLYGNLPPREISMKDVFRSGDSS